MEILVYLLFNLGLTAIAYMAFPLLRLWINHGKFEKNRAKKIALGNSIVLGIIFCVLTVSSDAGSTWNAGPAVLYYFINCAILTDKRSKNSFAGSEDEKSETEQTSSPILTEDNYLSREDFNDNRIKNDDNKVVYSYNGQDADFGYVPQKSKNKKKIACLAAIFFAVIVVAVVAVIFLIPAIKYNHAMKLLENGSYELAYSAFKELDGYSDSEEMLLECRYVQAIKYRDGGDYELANKIFESLGDYRDSKIFIHKHDYKLSNAVAATCATPGSETYKCTGCADTYIKTVTLTHVYVLTASEEANCQREGYKTYKCSLCNDEYTEKMGKTSHKSVVASTKDATCTMAGFKHYMCTTCGYEYTEEIDQKPHDYSEATCTEPKTCISCGKKEGTALGHSTSSVKCSNCGKITFETLTYSGTGSSVISNINLPSGQFRITCTLYSGAYTTMYFYYGTREDLIFNHYNPNAIKITVVSGPINNASIVINGESSFDSPANWKITIEAVGN